MAVFTDDFNRADGSLGSNWTVAYSSASISGGYAVGSSDTYVVTSAVTDTDYQDVTCHVAWLTGQGNTGGPLIKGATASRAGYWCQFTLSSGTWYFELYKRGASGSTLLTQTSYGTSIPYLSSMRITWDAGNITATVDGGHTLTSTDSQYALNTYMGMHLPTANTPINDFRAVGTQAAALSITPETVGNYNSTTDMSAVGTQTAWTAGTPGSPALTVDHGTISGQVVADATHMTFTYDPGDFLGYVTFTDPSTGMTDIVLVTSDPAIVPPTAPDWPNEGWKAVTNAAGNAHSTSLAVTEATLIHATEAPELNIDIVQAIAEIWAGMYHFRNGQNPTTDPTVEDLIWKAVNNRNEQSAYAWTPSRDTSLKEDTELIANLFVNAVSQTEWTIDELVASIKGLDNRSITQVYDIVNGLSTGSNQDVLDALAAYFGVNPPTIAQLGTMVSDLATIAGYTLGDVLDAIAAIPGTDLTPVMNKLNAMQPNTDYTFTTLTSRLADLQNDLTTLDGVADQILARVNLLPTDAGNAGAPVWPGLASVTLGTPVTLEEEPALTGPFDGVLINITTPPTKTGLRQFGTAPMDYGVGEIAFVTDNGYIEPWQYLGFRTALYTPKMMRQASAVKCRVLAGAAGTIRTFTSS